MKCFDHSVGKREEDDSSALDVMWGSFAHFSGAAAVASTIVAVASVALRKSGRPTSGGAAEREC